MRTGSSKAKLSHWTHLTVQSEPHIEDPRELQTILTFSLRSLWGDLEGHSCALQVTKEKNFMNIRCRKDSLESVRAALTLVSPPPYLESTIYRFDVIAVEEE